ncbi:SPOR domain-containing protein [Aquimixticola soesokkakensis]|nr:SPOR domain-containing protein [Aquimixticola soesokkakensis]
MTGHITGRRWVCGTSRRRRGVIAALLGTTLVLSGCDTTDFFNTADKDTPEIATDTSTRLVERDVEAPEVFQVDDEGLWDGRPSLGGVWVAHTEVKDPERVIIRNTANGKFVIGALFKRERTSPGPEFQVSSDAAAALGMLAGAPAALNVTALRREEAPDPVPSAALPDEAMPMPQADALGSETIAATPLDPVAEATAALDAIDAGTPAAVATPAPRPATPPAAAAPAKAATALDRPFLQIGIFSVEANASRTVQMLGSQGIAATVKQGENSGKPFWRVVVGPATSAAERSTLLEKVKAAGFTDAYAVTH